MHLAGNRTHFLLAATLVAVLALAGMSASTADAATVPQVAASGVSTDTHKEVTKVTPIPFKTVTKSTSTLASGTRKTSVKGVTGQRTTVTDFTLRDGVRVAKKVISSTVTRAPVTKVILVGTKPAASKCDPNYSGECVPIASDVDCAGGSGNGPGYVYGTVRVIGTDIYDLDRDGDGYGCD